MRPDYAVYWSEGDEPRRAGKLEVGRMHALLSAAGKRLALPHDEIAAIDYSHGKLRLQRRGGATITIGSLDAPGALLELAGRLRAVSL